MEDHLGFLVRLVQLDVFEEFSRLLADLGTTPARYSVLAFMGANPGVRPGAMAGELRIKPPNLAVLLNGLEAEGLVRRQPDQAELRANQVWLTPAGIQALAAMQPRVQAIDDRLTAVLQPAERRELVRLLRRILARPR